MLDKYELITEKLDKIETYLATHYGELDVGGLLESITDAMVLMVDELNNQAESIATLKEHWHDDGNYMTGERVRY